MIHVFVGPTLEPGEGVLRAPLVRVHPPVQHGDLADESIAAGHTAVLIDGVYHQAPALRHKEILAAVARGVRVIGAASIGALRAAELHGHGVIGVGRIYRAYVCGELTGDDEVAVGQAPDGDLRALTWPLVNLRHMVRAGERAGLLNADGAAALLRDFAAVHYPARTEGVVRAVCRRAGQTEFYRWVEEQRTADRHWGDVKRADALAALRLAHCPLTAAGSPAVWETGYSRGWSNELAGGERPVRSARHQRPLHPAGTGVGRDVRRLPDRPGPAGAVGRRGPTAVEGPGRNQARPAAAGAAAPAAARVCPGCRRGAGLGPAGPPEGPVDPPGVAPVVGGEGAAGVDHLRVRDAGGEADGVDVPVRGPPATRPAVRPWPAGPPPGGHGPDGVSAAAPITGLPRSQMSTQRGQAQHDPYPGAREPVPTGPTPRRRCGPGYEIDDTEIRVYS